MKRVIDTYEFSHNTLNVWISLLSKIHGSLSAYLQQLNYQPIFVCKQVMVIKDFIMWNTEFRKVSNSWSDLQDRSCGLLINYVVHSSSRTAAAFAFRRHWTVWRQRLQYHFYLRDATYDVKWPWRRSLRWLCRPYDSASAT